MELFYIFIPFNTMLWPKFILTILTLTLFSVSYAQEAPKYSNEFMSIGVGARALAMSNTQTAHVRDITAGYYNPAGLIGMEGDYQFALMHAEYFAGIAKYDYGAIGMRLDSSSVLSASVIRLAVDDIPDTRFLYDANGSINYDNIRFFTAADYGFLISYAREVGLLGGLQLGGSAKIIHRKAGDFATAWGFGIDIGAQKHYKEWQFGLMLRDVTGTFNAWDHNPDLLADVYNQTGNDIPENSIEVTLPKAIVGLARYFTFKEHFGLLATLDLQTTFDGQRNTVIKADPVSVEPALGIEFDYKKIAYIRLGAGNIQEIKSYDNTTYWTIQPNFGVGIHIKQLYIDYALTDIGDQSASPYSHVFSLRAYLNKNSEE